jgi:hypothetical protein
LGSYSAIGGFASDPAEILATLRADGEQPAPEAARRIAPRSCLDRLGYRSHYDVYDV